MAAVRLARVGWKPRISVLGVLGGLLMGLGVVVLLQQYGKLYPTTQILVGGVIAGALLGGLVLPSLFRLIAIGRINGKIRRIEGRRAAASGVAAGAAAATAMPPPGIAGPPTDTAGPPPSAARKAPVRVPRAKK